MNFVNLLLHASHLAIGFLQFCSSVIVLVLLDRHFFVKVPLIFFKLTNVLVFIEYLDFDLPDLFVHRNLLLQYLSNSIGNL